jgi:hypothetical protein
MQNIIFGVIKKVEVDKVACGRRTKELWEENVPVDMY